MIVTLGEVICGLERANQDIPVVIGELSIVSYDFTEVISYKQYYAALAICYEKRFLLDEFKTVREVLQVLYRARNHYFRSLDYGEYLMTNNSEMWVANYGEFGDRVTGVHDFGDHIEIHFDVQS